MDVVGRKDLRKPHSTGPRIVRVSRAGLKRRRRGRIAGMRSVTLSLSAFAMLLLVFGWLSRDSQAEPVPQRVSGTVVSPRGEAVEGAVEIVASADEAAWPNVPADKRPEHKRGAGTTLTGTGGAFTIPLPPVAGLLVIHHSTGYAEVRPSALAENSRVKLEPWCRVEGVLKIGANTAPAGTKVNLGTFGWGMNAARAHWGYSTTTDAEGRYVLDRVPAGVAKIETKVSKSGAEVEQYTGASPDKPTRFD